MVSSDVRAHRWREKKEKVTLPRDNHSSRVCGGGVRGGGQGLARDMARVELASRTTRCPHF